MRSKALALLVLLAWLPRSARAQGTPPPAPIAPPPPPVYLEPPPPATYPQPAPSWQPQSPGQVQAQPQQVVPPPPFGPGVLRLHLDGPPGLVLKRDSGPAVRVFDLTGAHDSSGALCATPCDAIIDARGGTSFVFGGGEGTPDSSSFTLADQSGEVTARVDPGSRGLRLLSALGAGLSGAGIYLGLVTLTASADPNPNTRATAEQVGVGFLVGSGVLLLASGFMYLASRTTYDLRPNTAR